MSTATTPAGSSAAEAGEATFKPNASFGDSGKGLSNLGKIFSQAVEGGIPPEGAIPPVSEPRSEPKVAVEPTVEAKPAAVENPTDKNTTVVEPKVEAKPEVKESRSAQDFKLIKSQRDTVTTERDQIKAERDEFKKQLDSYEEKLKNAVPLDYEDVKKQKAELEARIERIAVEKSDSFLNKFDRPMDAALAKIAGEVAGVDGVDIDELTALVKNPTAKNRNERLNEIVSLLPTLQANRLVKSITDHEDIQASRSKALEDHKSFLTEAQKADQNNRQKQDAQFAKIIDDTILEATKVVPYMQPIEGNEQHNAQVKELNTAIRRNWLEPQSSEALAKLTVAGSIFPIVADHAVKLWNENQRITKELSELKGATAKVQSGAGSGAPPAVKQSITEIFKAGAGYRGD